MTDPTTDSGPACVAARLLWSSGAARRGTFTLSSGATSDLYVDVRRALLSLDGMRRLAWPLFELTRRWMPFDAIGGPSSGADSIVGAFLALMAIGDDELRAGAKLQGFLVRKETKGHGSRNRVDGPTPKPDSTCVVVEDVATTGASALRAVEAARDAGLVVKGVAALLDRHQGAAELLRGEGVSLVSLVDLPTLLAEEPTP